MYEVHKNSMKWNKARPIIYNIPIRVLYRGKVINIPANTTFYVDDNDDVLVGWHGTVSPPRGMNGKSLIV